MYIKSSVQKLKHTRKLIWLLLKGVLVKNLFKHHGNIKQDFTFCFQKTILRSQKLEVFYFQ